MKNNNKIKVQSCANIALIKYWGKRDTNLFLPTKSSLSVTLDVLKTVTSISFSEYEKDEIFINKEKCSKRFEEKVVSFLNFFRKKFSIKRFFKIETENSFPTSAGLASSASGFAALTFGLCKVCDINLTKKELSLLARRASGSACRSIYGGFVLWKIGKKNDGLDSFAEQVFDEKYWPEFRLLVLVACKKEKKIGSREAMQITVKTSDSYKEWIQESEKNIPKIIKAIKERDFKTVGQIAQNDCLKMHKTMRDSHPSINYFTQTTLNIIDKVKEIKSYGIDCYFTIDAGPNVKVLCLQKDLEKIKDKFKNFDGIKSIIECRVGKGLEIK